MGYYITMDRVSNVAIVLTNGKKLFVDADRAEINKEKGLLLLFNDHNKRIGEVLLEGVQGWYRNWLL